MSDDEGDYMDEGGDDLEYISEDDIENPYYVENDSDSDSDNDPEPLTPSTLCRLVSYDTKTEEEISEIQRKMIHECSDVLAIPHHDSLMLLQCFDWNLVNAQSSWYENESKTRARAGMRTSMTGDPLTLSRIGQCRICKRICKPAAAATEKKAPVIPPLPAGKAVGSTIKIVGRHLKKLTEDSFDYNLPDESNPFKVEVTFPCRGMWAGLTANICIDISDKYPMLPPTVTYLTPSSMLHPNIDDSGTICIPNLTPQEWSPTNNLSDVCEAMGKIFEIPDWDHALNGRAHELWTTKRPEFEKILRGLGATGVINPSAATGVLSSATTDTVASSVDEDTIMELYSMECGHQFCVECWSQVIEAKSGPDLLVTLCPSKDCKLIIPEPVVALMSPTAYTLYEDLKVKAYVAKDRKAKYCPNNCRRVCLYPKDRPSRKINCPCGHVWCWTCCNDPHYPISCKLLESYNTMKQNFYGGKSYADDWAAANIKTCQNPKCRKQLWKDGGCLQLNCRTEHGGCGQVMCWLCQGKWDSTHSDHFHCNKFEAEKAKGQLSGAVKTAYQAELNEKIRQEEKNRYDWFAERVQFFANGCRFAKERSLSTCDPPCERLKQQGRCLHGQLIAKKRAVADFLEPYLETPLSTFQEQCLEALEAGNDAYIRCSEALKSIYISKYQFPEDGPKFIFDANQDSLEEFANRLTAALEEDWVSIAQAQQIDPMGMFDKLREVIRLSQASLTFLQRMCEAPELQRVFGHDD